MPQRIAHLWSVTAETAEAGFSERVQGLGFYSLLYLAQALGLQATTQPIQITVVSSGMHAVGGESWVCADKATLLGPCRVIPQEYPHLSCRSVDVVAASPGSPEQARVVER